MTRDGSAAPPGNGGKHICVREYVQGENRLLAACDEELLGRSFREGKATITVSESFYLGQKVEEKDLHPLMKRCTIGNFTGPRTVKLAVEAGLVAEENVLTIEGVPHAQYAVFFV